jgi:GH3 auxin-responsive promoter
MSRCQARILRGLVHRAQATRFGREHDFRRIRSHDDFRRLVRLRTLAEFCRGYWPVTQSTFSDITWPGRIQSFIPGGSCSDNTPRRVPVTAAGLAAHLGAAATALSFIACARPRARLFLGEFVCPGLQGDDAPTTGFANGTLETSLLDHVPRVIRPYVLAEDWQGQAKTQHSRAPVPVTCAIGAVKQLSALFRDLLQATGRDRVIELWPHLAGVLYSGTARHVERTELRQLVGSARVLFLESWHRPEATIAVEDPGHRCLRLLADNGVFFEFVPAEEASEPEPPRHGLDDIVPGVTYEVAISSPAGVWACLTGQHVCFERRQPPLLRRVTLPKSPAPPLRSQRPHSSHIPAQILREAKRKVKSEPSHAR